MCIDNEEDLQYQLEQYATKLRRLCYRWHEVVAEVPPENLPRDGWGFTPVEMETLEMQARESFGEDQIDDDVDEGDLEGDEDDEHNAEFMEELEAQVISDAYHTFEDPLKSVELNFVTTKRIREQSDSDTE